MDVMFSILVSALTLATVMAGRSFPMEAEYDTTSTFQTVNPNMLLDETNFLVDVSGLHSQCSVAQNRRSGPMSITRKTATGATVYGMVDFIEGRAIDTNSLTVYIRNAFRKWTAVPRRGQTNAFRDQIGKSNRYGCSVQPGCEGYAVIACMFATI